MEAKGHLRFYLRPTGQRPLQGTICKCSGLYNSIQRRDSYVGFLNVKNNSKSENNIIKYDWSRENKQDVKALLMQFKSIISMKQQLSCSV